MGDERDSNVQIHIPAQLVEDTVRAELVRALGNTDALLKSVVARAFSETSTRSYGKTTIIEDEVNDMIRVESKKIFTEWIEENRQKLRDAFMASLNARKGTKLKQLIDAMFKGLTENFEVKVNIGYLRD